MCKNCLKIYEEIGKENKMGKSYVHNSQEDDCWEVEIETIEKCSKAPDEIKALMTPLAKVKVNALMEKFPNIEWFSYLIGQKTETEFIIEDLLIPQQTVTGTSVTDVICPDFNQHNIIGAMHSHHHMGTTFSGTDHKWVNQNHDISLVVSTNSIAGQARWKTPCGGMLIVPVKVVPYFNVDFDKEKFLEQEISKIQANPGFGNKAPKQISIVKANTDGSEKAFSHAELVARLNTGVTHNQPVQENLIEEEENEELLHALQEAYPDLKENDTVTTVGPKS